MKKVLGAIILFGLIGLLIAAASGGAGAPGGGPPGGGAPGGGGGVPAGGAADSDGYRLPTGFLPFSGLHYDAIITNVGPGQVLTLDLGGQSHDLEIIEGSVVYRKNSQNKNEFLTFQDLKRNQRIGLQAVGYKGRVVFEIEIVEEDWLIRTEKTQGRGIVPIEGVDGDWITIDKNRTVKVMPGCQITTYDKNGRTIPFTGQLFPGTKITVNISSRPDRNYEYTNRIYVH